MKKIKQFFVNIGKALKEFWNKWFRGYVYSNVGDFQKKLRTMPKKEIIRRILKVAGEINENPGMVEKDFIEHLKKHGKRHLEKTLTILQASLTDKLMGGKTEEKKK